MIDIILTFAICMGCVGLVMYYMGQEIERLAAIIELNSARIERLSEAASHDFAAQWRLQSKTPSIETIMEVQTCQQEQIDSLQKQLDSLREKTDDMFRAQAAQFNHRFAFQQELRQEHDKVAKLVQILWICFITNHQNFQHIVAPIIAMFANVTTTRNDQWNAMVHAFSTYALNNGYPTTELDVKRFTETIKNLC